MSRTEPTVQVLPPELANKIAAGEVVERPASVVKELVENSLDAGADRISVEIKGGGLELISVRDNGVGLSAEDARLALRRHATSKIKDAADLFNVRTMGFRGEALPAIASVSSFSLTSRRRADQAAVCLRVENGRFQSLEPKGAPVGTTVEAARLFADIPARLKFMKTQRTETGWIKEALVRLALSRPDVHFQLIDEDRETLDFPARDEDRQRLVDVFGPTAAERMIRVELDHPAVRVNGWIGPPDEAKTTAKAVYAFVNRRHVRDRVLLAALSRGYEGRLDRGRYPQAALFLDLEPGTVDVNVHPAKLEVRFHHSQAIHVAVVRAVSQALNLAERLGGAQDRARPPKPDSRPGWRVAEPGGDWGSGRSSRPSQPSPAEDWTKPLSTGRSRAYHPPVQGLEPSGEARGALKPDEPDILTGFRYLGSYAGRYLLGQSGSELVLIDQHAAHERLLFNRLTSEPGPGQPLLLPLTLTFTPLQAEAVNRARPELARLGLEVEPFGPDGRTYNVKSLPAVLSGQDPEALIEGLAEELGSGGALPPQSALAAKLASLACRAALKSGRELKAEEVTSLVERLGRMAGPLTCPHGRPILIRLSQDEIDGRFKRR